MRLKSMPWLNQSAAAMLERPFYTVDGVEKYVRFEPVDDWGLAVTANYDDYMATHREVQLMVLMMMAITILVAILLIYIFTNHTNH